MSRNEEKRQQNLQWWKENKENLFQVIEPGTWIAVQFPTEEGTMYSGMVIVEKIKVESRTLVVRTMHEDGGPTILPYDNILCAKFVR